MSYSIACKDAGMNCPGAFTTESESELIEHVEMHARKAHPDMRLDDQARQQIRQLVKTA
jgi:predicted small metal-binding protein